MIIKAVSFDTVFSFLSNEKSLAQMSKGLMNKIKEFFERLIDELNNIINRLALTRSEVRTHRLTKVESK